MITTHRERDTVRARDWSADAIAALSDDELEREMTIAALSSHRNGRYERLLAERRRRRHHR